MAARPGTIGGWLALSVFGVLGACAVLRGQDAPAREPKLRTVLRGHTNDVRSVAVTADGQTLVSGGDDLTVRVWDVAAGKERTALRGHEGRIDFVAVTPDGRTVASADQAGVIKLWDVL